MAEQDLNIRLTLINNISAGLTKVTAQINDMGKTVQQVGRQIGQLGTSMTFLGAAITGPLVLAMKTASKYSLEVSGEFRRMDTSIANLNISIGQSLVPVMRTLNTIIDNLREKWESISKA